MCSSSHHRGTSTPTQCNDAPITPPNRSIGPAYYTLKHEEPINLWMVTPGACTLALIHGFSRRFFDVHRCQHLISLGVYAAMNIWKEKSEVSVGVLEVDLMFSTTQPGGLMGPPVIWRLPPFPRTRMSAVLLLRCRRR